MFEIKIEGLKEIEQALKQFPEKLQKKYMKDAVKAGAKIIAENARAKAPVSLKGQPFGKYKHQRGNLKAAIKVYSAKLSEIKKRASKYWGLPVGFLTFRQGNLLSTYGVFITRRATKNDAWYWHMVEGGHAIWNVKGKTLRHLRAKGITVNTGKVPPKRFMSNAFKESEYRVVNMITAKLNMALQNARTTL